MLRDAHRPAGDEAELTTELRAGSESAFNWLVTHYHGLVFGLVVTILSDQGEAADVIPVEISLVDLMVHLYRNANFDQLIWEFGSWVHVSYTAKQTPRHEALMASRNRGGGVSYARMTAEQVIELAA